MDSGHVGKVRHTDNSALCEHLDSESRTPSSRHESTCCKNFKFEIASDKGTSNLYSLINALKTSLSIDPWAFVYFCRIDS